LPFRRCRSAVLQFSGSAVPRYAVTQTSGTQRMWLTHASIVLRSGCAVSLTRANCAGEYIMECVRAHASCPMDVRSGLLRSFDHEARCAVRCVPAMFNA
jgi:hypothetical protein